MNKATVYFLIKFTHAQTFKTWLQQITDSLGRASYLCNSPASARPPRRHVFSNLIRSRGRTKRVVSRAPPIRCVTKMNDADVSKQIQQMVRFIRQEAEEKANEISVSAEEVRLISLQRSSALFPFFVCPLICFVDLNLQNPQFLRVYLGFSCHSFPYRISIFLCIMFWQCLDLFFFYGFVWIWVISPFRLPLPLHTCWCGWGWVGHIRYVMGCLVT